MCKSATSGLLAIVTMYITTTTNNIIMLIISIVKDVTEWMWFTEMNCEETQGYNYYTVTTVYMHGA